MTPRPVIARSDLLTAYGQGIDALWNGLIKNQTAIRASTRFNNRAFTSNQIAEIPDLTPAPGQSRSRAMLEQLLEPLKNRLDPDTTLILATTVCEIEFIERSITENNTELAHSADPQVLLAYLKSFLNLKGPATVFSSACASSSAALTQAATLIQRQQSTAVLILACDSISEFVYSGFSTLMSLCDTPARPFDADRCGLTLGEAAAWALVTPHDSPLANQDSLAILGWCNTTDAVHMTAPDRNAAGLSRAIQSACQMANLHPQNISLIAAHGTATVYNDAMELTAFTREFVSPIPTFSIKGAIGHTLGAAGLTQILTVAHALKTSTAPPTVGLTTPDARAVDWVHDHSRALPSDAVALSTNSGFGGVNTAIILGRPSVSTEIKVRPSTPDAGPLQSDVRISTVSISWFSPRSAGWFNSNQKQSHPSPTLSNTRAMTQLIDRTPKYFARMTPDARTCLAAASLAMQAANWNNSPAKIIGILGTGYDGCITADKNYFHDFITSGQSLGRANLFIYTLPTSALSEVAIALNLTGPTLHVHHETSSVPRLIEQARQLIQQHQADAMLVLATNGQSALCLAVGTGFTPESFDTIPWQSPLTDIIESCENLIR